VSSFQFYVTPLELAARVWEKFEDRDFARVLDAFAGTGALAAAVPTWSRSYGSRDVKIDAIELDGAKHPLLRELGLQIVGLDFFAFEGGEIYSHVVLNPPFAFGARAVLGAWDMLWEGEIVAILNAETIRNPYSAERQRLARLIEEYGSVEIIANAFKGATVEREAEVDCALVHLKKPAECARDWIGDLLAKMETDPHRESGIELPTELALPRSFVETQCAAFRAAVKAMREAARTSAVAAHYSSRIGKTMAEQNGDKGSKVAPDMRKALETGYTELKDRAWTSVLRSTETLTRLSQKVQKQAESRFEDIKRLDFTEQNIYGFLLGLVESQPEMQLDMACDVFDTITRHHTENTVFYRGWKSNDKHHRGARRIRTSRFIIPGHGDSYGLSRHSPRWETVQQLADFDKVFALMDGKRKPEVGLVDVFQSEWARLLDGERVPCSYFDVRFYRGVGTIHFFARSKELVDRLNRTVGRHREWLPPQGERVPDAFWLQYEKAERFDGEVRAAVKAGSDRWSDPFRELMWSDSDGRGERAAAAIEGAIDQVLAKHGVTLALTTQSAPVQLMLTAEEATS
jgi:hypothetical protein